MIKATACYDDWIGLDKIDFKREVIFFNNKIDYNILGNENIFKVLLTFSEPEYFRISNSEVILNSNNLDLILTYDEDILDKCPNARKFVLGTSCVKQEEAASIDYMKKEFKVSFICGGKNHLDGHRLRQEIWERQKEIKIKKEFWISSQSSLKDVDNNKIYPKDIDKFLLFKDAQFHICVENSKLNNYFTEKICDCFNTYTVPIYWGSLNIGDYFDKKGIIIFEDIPDMMNKINNLTEKDYYERIDSMLSNKQKVKKYLVDMAYRIKSIVEPLL